MLKNFYMTHIYSVPILLRLGGGAGPDPGGGGGGGGCGGCNPPFCSNFLIKYLT